jgi:hypothetical protein
MASFNQPRNRKDRRAQARANAPQESSKVQNPFSQLSPPHKTLIEIAAERELLNGTKVKNLSENSSSSIVTTVINSDGSLSEPSETILGSGDPVPTPYFDVALYTFTLTLLHFTLTFLVHHQYDTEPPSVRGLILSATVFSFAPWLILLLVLLLHPRSSEPHVQILFAAMSIVAGGWLVHATNDEPYMAVMKKAPALGTLWVWATVEMRWEWAVGCSGVVGAMGWWKGYTIF